MKVIHFLPAAGFPLIMFLSLLLSWGIPAAAGASETQDNPANFFYLELGGAGGFYSFNVEKGLTAHSSVRFGVSYFHLFDKIYTFPVTYNHLVGQRTHFLELGIGLTPVYEKGTGFSLFPDEVDDEVKEEIHNFWSAYLGYRYQPEAHNFMFRLGFSPLINEGRFFPYGGVSFGLRF